ncbi:MAG: adenylate/guanylate cyclase domain-containing protein [Pseudomonadota bacterium]
MTEPSTDLRSDTTSTARAAIAREERVGFSFMLWGRLAVLGLLATWIILTVSEERSNLYLALIAVFALLGTMPYALARKGVGGFAVIAAFLILEAGVLSYILIVPMPFEIESWTQQMNLRLPGFLYLGVFLVSMALSYSPTLVIWAGVVSIVTWSIGYLWVANLPDTTFMWPLDLLNEGVTSQEFIERYLEPHVVRPNFFLNQIAFLSAVTVVLALTVWRSRSLIQRVLSAERQREDALAQQHFVRETFGKFVPDTVVKEILSDRGQLLPKRRLATVLFADLEGFTALSKRVSSEMLLRVLNEYFEEAGAIITAHGGTITQFQGDALLASFNVPIDADDHAFDAVCAATELVEMAASRTFEGEGLRVRIGINTGDVAAGAVGGADRLTYTIHGECVNIAARLEQLNKETGTQILMTAETAAAVGDRAEIRFVGAFDIRGVSGPVDIYSVN